jgi:TPR repeat protein
MNRLFHLTFVLSILLMTSSCTLQKQVTVHQSPPSHEVASEKNGAYFRSKARQSLDQNDGENAVLYLEKAVSLGEIKALKNLGVLYFQGKHVGKDLTKAIYWFEKSSNENVTDSMAFLGDIYIDETSEIYSPAKAIYWLERAAKLEDLDAQYNLGVIYYQGAKSLSRDYNLAHKWWLKASKSNHIESMNNLAALYHQGDGVGIDFDISSYWYKRSCSSGYKPACDSLRDLFDLNKLSKVNARKIIKWAVSSLPTEHPFSLLYSQIKIATRAYVKAECDTLFSFSYDYECAAGSGLKSGTIKIDFDGDTPDKAIIEIDSKNMQTFIEMAKVNDSVKHLQTPQNIKIFFEEWFVKINRDHNNVYYSLDGNNILIEFSF